MAGFWLPPEGMAWQGMGCSQLLAPGTVCTSSGLPGSRGTEKQTGKPYSQCQRKKKKEGKKKKAKTIRQQDLKSDAPFPAPYEWITPTGRVGKLYLVYSLELNICSYWIVQCGVINPAACGNRMLLGSSYSITSSLGWDTPWSMFRSSFLHFIFKFSFLKGHFRDLSDPLTSNSILSPP